VRHYRSAFLLAAVALGPAIGCSSSSQGGTQTVDSGGGGGQEAASTSEAGSDAGDGGDGACNIPALATAMNEPDAGIHCTAVSDTIQCGAMYRIVCTAPDPYTLPAPPDNSLMCNMQPNGANPAQYYYCCPCK
jgi:hypothetical protein